MKRLIIAEKPSLARFVMSCIHENFVSKKYKSDTCTYYESQNYFISFSFGHLFEAYSIEDYNPNFAEWRLDYLPFFPPDDKFYFRVKTSKDSKTKERRTDPAYKLQFDTLNYLVNHPDTESLIHCGDAATEGEIIVREIINNTNIHEKPVFRLWFNEQTETACINALQNMKPDSYYDNYAKEGFARLKRDWLYGINLSRFLSVKAKTPAGKPLRAGRVICAMIHEIYERDMLIENFIPETYYALISDEETHGEKIHLRCSKKYPRENFLQATEKCAFLNNSQAYVADIIQEKKVVPAGNLYSLTTLQNRLSTDFGMSLSESMKHIQTLYESGYITYPRTNSKFLGTSEKDNVRKLLALFQKEGYEVIFKDTKSIFDDSKIEDHSALIPTYKIPRNLTGQEKIVYETIRNRFLAVFCEEQYIVNKSTLKVVCGEEVFNINGNITIQEGFTKYDEKKIKENHLPNLKIGDAVSISFFPQEENTKPPSHYTVATFNTFLEAPYSKENSTDDEIFESIKKGLEIGTVASRGGIIQNMINSEYIKLDNQTYLIQPLGKYLIEAMKSLDISMTKERTVEGSIILKQVKNGILTESEAIQQAKNDLSTMLAHATGEIPSLPALEESLQVALGKCPICGDNVCEYQKFFACHNHAQNKTDEKCPLIFWKNDRFIEKVTEKPLSKATVSALLSRGSAFIKSKDREGNPSEAYIRYKIVDEKVQWESVYELGSCPVCKVGNVHIAPFGYICDRNNKENKQCYFVLFKNDKFIQAYTKNMLSPSQVSSLLKQGYITTSVAKKDSTEKYKVKFKLNIQPNEHRISWTKEYVNQKKK